MEKDEITERLKELLKKIGVDFTDVSVSDVAGQTVFTVNTKDSGMLIGASGDTLSALNHLVKKMFESKEEKDNPFRYIIDVNGYHMKHIKNLETQAKMLAERARTFKYDVDMSPMSAYDRLIVHSSLQDIPEVKTESQGEGVLRHIVIKYVDSAGTVAAPPEAPTFD